MPVQNYKCTHKPFASTSEVSINRKPSCCWGSRSYYV